MHNGNICKGEHGFRGNRNRRGPSSFSMQHPSLVFSELKLKAGEIFLDMGCGAGDYTIEAAKRLGDSGVVYALDVWKELINNLANEIDSNGLKNIKPMVADITDKLPIEDNSVDICFIATVLHAIDIGKTKNNVFSEIHRVLKPNGRLAIIECKKEERHFGPPIHMRLSPQELEALTLQYGFKKTDLVDLGYNYMLQLTVK
jgi:ubiquinone/menaquinone biosynthesis C-methylase UbiE